MSASAPGSVIERRNARDAAVVAAQLEDLLDDRAVLALELARSGRGGGVVVGPLLDLDAQAPVGSVVRPRRATPRCRPVEGRRRAPPPGRRTRSSTSATVPTFA